MVKQVAWRVLFVSILVSSAHAAGDVGDPLQDARALVAAGKIIEAKVVLGEGLRRCERRYGTSHPNVAEIQLEIGRVLGHMSRLGEAQEQLILAHRTFRKRFGETDPRTVSALRERGIILAREEDDNDEAVRILEACRRLESRCAVEEQLSTVLWMSEVLLRIERGDRAVAAFEGLDLKPDSEPDEKRSALRLNLGIAYLTQGRLSEARGFLSQCASIRGDTAELRRVACRASVFLGAVYAEQGDQVAAVRALKESVGRLREDFGATGVTAVGLADVASILESMDVESSLKCSLIEESLDIRRARIDRIVATQGTDYIGLVPFYIDLAREEARFSRHECAVESIDRAIALVLESENYELYATRHKRERIRDLRKWRRSVLEDARGASGSSSSR